ncbi:MAG: CapA family protein [Anaerolineae bacterium]|nr:CapA family protein [Anaerolineae bacterium]
MQRLMTRAAVVMITLMVLGCGASQQTTPPILTATSIPLPTVTDTPTPPTVWIQPGVPAAIIDSIVPILADAGYVQTENAGADIQIALNPSSTFALTAQWVYALVAPFPTVPDDVSSSDFHSYWQGGSTTLPGFDVPPQIIVTQSMVDVFTARFGAPGANIPLTIIDDAQADQLDNLAWDVRPAISMIPFEQLDPTWKVLTIDGQSPLDRAVDVNTYPLTIRIGAAAANDAGNRAIDLLQSSRAWLSTNRDTSRMTVIVMTGVTALTRATAYFMDIRGIAYPADKIAPFFADADILHTSNEVSFTPQCPPPDPNGDETFCSDPKYFELLTTIDLDIVELTGNHNNDYGTAPSGYSLDLYDRNGIAYYGGGRDLADATAPRILTTPDGTRIAFVGCNSAGPYKAWATDYTPGAAPCDDWSGIQQTIADLKTGDQADIVIVTLQYIELPQYAPSDRQRSDFEALAAAGADIISGSQAHQPMGFSFAHGKFIHFGVGNLFFDQMDYIENRQMFADKYILYEGRLVSVVLFTGMMEDYCQPRPMTPEERADFLALIFEKNGW